MICKLLKQCIEVTHHMEPLKEKRRKKGNKTVEKRDKKIDVYEQPLCQSPCCNKAQQDMCIGFLDKRSKATCSENGKSYTLDQSQEHSKHEVLKIHIDNGVITNPEACAVDKCDYAILINDGVRRDKKQGTGILIELKGKDIRHAVKQIMETLHRPEFYDAWESRARMYGRIICTSVPRIHSNDEIMDAKEEFLIRGGNLLIKEKSYADVYGEL